MKPSLKILLYALASSIMGVCWYPAQAQTDADAIMMAKRNFCVGAVYGYSSWDHYWEGTLKRNNENLGTVSTQSVAVMGNYGISSKLNILFGIPYIQTKASAGTLHGLKGMQDLSLWVKYMPVETDLGAGTLSLYGVGGISFPVSNYVVDFLPLSLGLGSTNLTLRAIADYQVGDFFATASGSYVVRSNTTIDRSSYYTTEMHYTNKVSMPNATQYNVRLGYRTERMIAEAMLSNWTTQGGFDITRNNMPFPSNRMNMTNAGLALKYNVKAVDGLALIANTSYTLAGRNVGQATSFNGGVFYILAFHATKKDSNKPAQN
ncbi:MAG: hypothetical protein KGO82_11685 [Bacteroidota bacterium]|nr:hypothetical protein [Bacteroidota bacterium]